ncbi:MAG: Re/Si-specific NAD(P)(+) transhydrogenase subunit alpha [Acidobacteria bacterium]|nr:Re/Si-specific NAD(P)(+) transhydrogenase subunit alpha [Acidobacteriota bacterium]NIM63816.1 Re/Si-specific NAD(P)(+) transhydrogenase subunit alpha [Acidobacteriota bacterium]NIO59750.1 Re/Si-specific NAD(P)(+) transhydrogenase subunit alpha [Acidobacteriota bacterium]NIQ30833.1 Re/Si-specific NAD(P)(+) transhydrogenase subunit alpha [Acidobacteriota bacterium]NIQ85906.1 Re/Si-specific NAD(P)(+) transhydrogenase subunit alpha [Acidobacteriota bacterium]
MIVGTVKETFPGETRVALTPSVLGSLTKLGAEVLVETAAGDAAGYPDATFSEKGATIVSRADVFSRADVVLQIRGLGANPEAGTADVASTRRGQVLIASFEPLTAADQVRTIAETGATLFALELVPRITRAQSMDILSSMATIAGYKAVLLAAEHLPKMFPMMMTAAGTVKPAKVLVIGAGVAGLQAIASSRRLGAQVEAYDIRAAVKEQVESLGAKFVELELDAGDAEDKGGYAKAMDEEFYRRQRAALAKAVEPMDVVISTAAIPGRQAPLLLTADAVRGMAPGSVIVDLAAETGGNCELTQAGQTVVEDGVTILGPTNLAASVPYHASQMFSKNIVTFLLNMVTKEGKLEISTEDEVVAGSLVTRDGEIVHPRVREVMGLPALTPAAPA